MKIQKDKKIKISKAQKKETLSVKDITTAKHVDKIVKTMLDNVVIGISMISPKMEIIWLNKTLKNWFPTIDVRKKPFCYKSFYSPPKDKICDYCPTIKAFRTGEIHSSETGICADGKIYNVIATPVKDKKGEIAYVVETVEDITNRKRAEESLQKSEEEFRLLFEAAVDAIFWADPETGLIIKCNKAAEVLLEKTKEEIIGHHQITLHPPQKSEYYSKLFKEHLAKRRIVNEEAEVITKSGKIKPVRISATVASVGEKQIIQGIFHDITEQKKMEEQILQSKQDWEETFNAITDMVTLHDKNFNIIRANKTAEKILKLPPLKINKEIKCFRYYHGRDCPPEGCPSCQCLKTGKPATFEMFEPHLNMYIEIRAMPRFDNNNQLIGLIHIVRDITERKKIENAIKRAKIEWETTFDIVTEFIILIDKDFNIIRCNKSFAEFVGVPIDKLIGHKYYEYFPPLDPEKFGHYKELIQKGEPITRIEVNTDKGRWFYVSHRPILDEKGKFLYSVIIATDITELKKIQQKLTKSEEELKERVESLEKFYEMAIDRELRMKELKREIRELRAELSRYKKYDEKEDFNRR